MLTLLLPSLLPTDPAVAEPGCLLTLLLLDEHAAVDPAAVEPTAVEARCC